jgi:hypothetical protein
MMTARAAEGYGGEAQVAATAVEAWDEDLDAFLS